MEQKAKHPLVSPFLRGTEGGSNRGTEGGSKKGRGGSKKGRGGSKKGRGGSIKEEEDLHDS
jgi:hypothetical protein